MINYRRLVAPAVAIIGFIAVVSATVVYVMMPTIIANTVSEDVAIASKESKLYSGWLNPQSDGIDMFRQFSFFNLTNPYEVGNGSVPNFVMRGPWVYREVRQKIPSSVQWFNNGSVAYKYTSTYFFEPSMSVDKQTGERLYEDEVLTVLNAPLYGIAHRLGKLPRDLRILACMLLNYDVKTILSPKGLMVQRSVKEILWGYTDPIWKSVHGWLPLLHYTAATNFSAEWNGSYVVPSPYSYRSGQMCPLWDNISQCNNSANGFSMELSGSNWKSGPVDNGMMNTWAGQWDLWWWGPEREGIDGGEEVLPPDPTHPFEVDLSSNNTTAASQPTNHTPTPTPTSRSPKLQCQIPEGYDGSRFPPNGAVVKKGKLRLFLDMIWRSLDFVHVGWSTVRGIETARFELDPDVLSPHKDDNHVCYGQRKYGVLNVSRPLFGPALGTKAMYLDSNITEEDVNYTVSKSWNGPRTPVLQYLEETYGSRDSAEFRRQFDSFLDIHPLTGLTLDVVAQGTASTYFGPIDINGDEKCNMLNVSKNLPTLEYYPLVSVLRETKVSESKAAQLRHYLFLIDVAHCCNIAAFVVGGLMMAIPLALHLRAKAKQTKDDTERGPETETSPILAKDGLQ